ncbi:uncharacterized protein L969DRAFT_85465 [Mixia osmundae IAM 14324]|uniref:G-protein coupled receptors family 1 profile domain-containing protein n=1 Tax=Mixia osmundae (strain CBS 9802 / IAM 14324 / JCM 22182 / KY 12970) TaxID=764103 RepID=G7DYV1_MIXOS|nr:uncharacterized protein L969DRAFT_85465 [Mixia osmundae IAM 14324]KEI41657.1 hypothetical protein L969DRAFT_85465 [Mixia osmundae IAM 14324]GAA95761.1 hypothetical protein E5Q_02418 [Mixia osmundae IAM 14324]
MESPTPPVAPTLTIGYVLASPTAQNDGIALGLASVYTVDLVISSVSLAAAIGMLTGCYLISAGRDSGARLRQRLIMSLALSDIVDSAVIIATTSRGVDHPLSSFSPGCNAAGFLYQTATLVNDFCLIAIATATYLIVTHPLSVFTQRMTQTRWVIVLNVFMWGLSAIVSGVGLAVYGFADLGGFCSYGKNAGPFKDLILFVPRTVTFIIVILIYLKLFAFFRRKDSHAVHSYDSGPAGQSLDAIPDFDEDGNLKPERSRKMSLASLQHWYISASIRRGSSSSVRKESKDSDATLVEPSATSASIRSSPTTSTAFQHTMEKTASAMSARDKHDLASRQRWSTYSFTPGPAVLETSEAVPDSPIVSPKHAVHSAGVIESSPEPGLKEYTPGSIPMSHRTGTLPSSDSMSRGMSDSVRRGSLSAIPARILAEAGLSPVMAAPPIPSSQEILEFGDRERRRSSAPTLDHDKIEEDDMKGMSFSEALNAPTKNTKGVLQDVDEANVKPRMSAQEMNRRASMLMLLYPAAYIILFSVSLGRLINNLANHGQGNSDLQAASRWLVFLQGFVDALIYLIIEWRFRAAAKGRT